MVNNVQPALEEVPRLLTLLPVGLKEAALDSPTFRATAVHFSDQVEIIERWLDAYVKSTSKLVHDVSALEETINAFLNRSIPPGNISEAVLDHDYTLLAMQRFAEGSREWWLQCIGSMKKMDSTLVEPIKGFMNGELRNFKDARRYLEQSQKTFDVTLSRYLGQSKTKEPSSLREDAFQVHEARKAYLKASLDFCILAPQLRFTMDKLLVRVSTDQWKEMKRSRELAGSTFAQVNNEMERIKGWSREMDDGIGTFRKELQVARKEIAETASTATRPSRELEDYNVSTVAFLGSKGPSVLNTLHRGAGGIERAEKQGWLYQRIISGKPARTVWVRRWFYVKNGIFGWLVQGAHSGGVEESEKIGVLLCNVKPAVAEDRRFSFEVKTKNSTILLQAETQSQLMEWLEAFEYAKNKAVKANAGDELPFSGGIDPAFAITPPSAPEFAAKNDGHAATGSEEFASSTVDRSNTLPVPGFEMGNLATRASFDVSNPRRSAIAREEGESGRDHAARIIQKLDLHRKSAMNSPEFQPPLTPGPTGGIASLISASQNILPVYAPAASQSLFSGQKPSVPFKDVHTCTLAPSTLANPPAPTNLSKSAVIVSGERGVGIGRSDATGGMPSGIMANLWGSANWGYINRFDGKAIESRAPGGQMPPSPGVQTSDENRKPDSGLPPSLEKSINTSIEANPPTPVTGPGHRKAISVDAEAAKLQNQSGPKPEVFPSNYPLELKTQEAQFRMLFPNVPREDKLVLVFRATWNPNEQQEFPGRVYVTTKDIYFYSHHLGLVLITSVALDKIDEVTAAPGKDCDFIFLHLKEGTCTGGFTRITIKTFLEPLRLLQSRLSFLIEARQEGLEMSLEDMMAKLIKLETEDPRDDSSMESWEDVSMNTPVDDGTAEGRQSRRRVRDLKRAIHVERGMQLGQPAKLGTKFALPSHPIVYEPPNVDRKVIEKQFDISPKSLFHVMFGDKSAVFQLLYHERRAQKIAQGPWIHLECGLMKREFNFQIDYVDMFRRQRQANIVDSQTIDVLNDHVCYVVTDNKTPWHLPHHNDFMLVSKIVITHVAKSKCKLAIFSKVEWTKHPTFSKNIVQRQALNDLELDALDLTDVVSDQVRKLGAHSRTKKAIQIFGYVGHQTSTSLFSSTDFSASKRQQIKQRTLSSMVYETTSSFAESAASSVLMWTFAGLRKLWEISSAHSIILSLLALSVLTNIFMSGKDSSEWWTERNAANFMGRIGVGPNTMMSKAVYLADLDEAMHPIPLAAVDMAVGGDADTRCYQTFRAMANATDMDAPYTLAGSALNEKSTKSTANRLRRTRQHLGAYRHDLLVAMRVVNRVETEVVRAEWENWLVDENAKCRQVKALLREKGKGGKGKRGESQQVLGGYEGTIEGLKKWQGEYCNSCRRELENVVHDNRFTSV